MSREPWYEIRPDACDFDVFGVDEVVAWHPEFVHLERMTNGAYWIGIDMPDGVHIRVWLQATGLAPKDMRETDDRYLIHCSAEAQGGQPWPTAPTGRTEGGER